MIDNVWIYFLSLLNPIGPLLGALTGLLLVRFFSSNLIDFFLRVHVVSLFKPVKTSKKGG